MDHLFAYGTLICADIMAEVSGVELASQEGVLRGYSRWLVKGEHYPAIVRDADGSVDGVLYGNVPEEAWERLNRFEGEMYQRQRVSVDLASGESLPAVVYVLRESFRQYLDGRVWDRETFVREGKEQFLQEYRGYGAL